MRTKKINGNTIARTLLKDLKIAIEKQSNKQKRVEYKFPKLGIILTDNNPASESYIRKKTRIARLIGIKTRIHKIVPQLDLFQLENKIKEIIIKMNNDKKYHGIMMQLPIIKQLADSEEKLLNFIDPLKDVDCLTQKNKSELMQKGSKAYMVPCTPLGIMNVLKSRKISFQDKNLLIIGRGKLVGNPLFHILKNISQNLSQVDQTVQLTEIKNKARSADIIFTATGCKDILNSNDIKKGSIIIDCGIIKNSQGKHRIRGDISEQVKQEMCSFYTPVPKGIGPMTVYSLMSNVSKAWRFQRKNN